MNDIVEFLRARLDEDEAVAQAAGGGQWSTGSRDIDGDWSDGPSVAGDDLTIYDEGGHTVEHAHHIARWDPARVLAEVAAKRQLIQPHGPGREGEDRDGEPAVYCTGHNAPTLYPCRTLLLLAQPYAAHPNFDPVWLIP